MSDTSYGLLSGKYVSTKQRAVLLNGDRLRNYQSYTATMRMELLLTGQLVLTDAQFFDGLYFHWLGKDKSPTYPLIIWWAEVVLKQALTATRYASYV